jgi:hypothetical protein
VRRPADEETVTPTNAYTELSGQRLDHGRGYDKRSVETFRARALDLVDELLRHVTELQDRMAAGGVPSLSGAENDLLHAFRYADSFQKREALAVLQGHAGLTRPSDDEQHEPVVATEFDDWLVSFSDAVAVPSVDLRNPAAPEPALRLPIRVSPVEGAARPPTPPTPWGGWVD